MGPEFEVADINDLVEEHSGELTTDEPLQHQDNIRMRCTRLVRQRRTE